MGYRSYGNLVFPAKYLPRFAETVYPNSEPNFGEWDERDAWRNPEGIDMIRLSYSGWKWYESYQDIQRIEKFMGDLRELSDEQWKYKDKVFMLTEEIPDCVVTEDLTKIKAINNFTVGLKAVMWDWGFNRQGEETEDYDQYGDSNTLSHESEIDWGYFSEYVSGEGWIYAVEVTPAEKAILEAVKVEMKPHPEDDDIEEVVGGPPQGCSQDFFESKRYDYKTKKSYQTNYCILYGDLPMPSLTGVNPTLYNYFKEHLGEESMDKKDDDDTSVWAEASWNDNSGVYHLEGNNYWEWEVYNNSFPEFYWQGKALDFDQVLQSYMKVAKEE